MVGNRLLLVPPAGAPRSLLLLLLRLVVLLLFMLFAPCVLLLLMMFFLAFAFLFAVSLNGISAPLPMQGMDVVGLGRDVSSVPDGFTLLLLGQALVHGRLTNESADRSSLALAIGERGCLGVADKSQQLLQQSQLHAVGGNNNPASSGSSSSQQQYT